MKTSTTKQLQPETAEPKANKQAAIGSILQRYKNKSEATVQFWPDKPLYVSGPGKGFIPLMGAQFDPKYREQEHKELLDSIPQDQCPAKTFHQENKFAARYPIEGSKSLLGDLGIYAHKSYNSIFGPK